MSDDKNKKGGADRSKVAAGEKWEVSYMMQKLNVSAEDVANAVAAVGNDRDDVEAYLKGERK